MNMCEELTCKHYKCDNCEELTYRFIPPCETCGGKYCRKCWDEGKHSIEVG